MFKKKISTHQVVICQLSLRANMKLVFGFNSAPLGQS